MSPQLLVDCCNGSVCELQLVNESTTVKGGLIKFRGKFQEAEAINKNKRMYPYNVLNENVKMLNEAINERRLIGELDHPCLIDSEFDVLTSNGWVSFKSIRKNDKVYSRVNGKLVLSNVNDIIDQPYEGKVISLKGRSIDCTFTAPHKMLMSDRNEKEYYITVEELHNDRTKHSHSCIPKTAIWDVEEDEYITIPGVERPMLDCSKDLIIRSDKFMLFLGLWLAEGSISSAKYANRVFIHQRNEYGRKLIRPILENMFDVCWKETKTGFEIADARLYDYLKPLGNVYNKFIPKEIKQLSSKLLEKLILGFAIGDGRIQKNSKNCKDLFDINDLSLDMGSFSRINIFSVSERLIDDLHECLVKTGRAGNKSVIISKKDYKFAGRIIKAENKKPLYQLHICRSANIHADVRFLKSYEDYYVGSIYCLATQYGNFYMRYKGKSFWTGNCDSIVHFANASHVVTKLWWEGNTLMGEGEILSTPSGRILQALLNDGIKIGISSRGVGQGTTNEDGTLVIGEGYKLITFDAVADPSTYAAFQERVNKKVNNESSVEKNYNNFDKNENSSIDTLSKEALVACLEQIINSHVERA